MAGLFGNTDPNFGFTGIVPPGVSVENNIVRMLEYRKTHTLEETYDWWYDHVRNNLDRHLSLSDSMDYKQIGSEYADFGNFNYAVLGSVLGLPDAVVLKGAGWAQQLSDGWGEKPGGRLVSAIIAGLDFVNNGDNPEDQVQIRLGITAADNADAYAIATASGPMTSFWNLPGTNTSPTATVTKNSASKIFEATDSSGGVRIIETDDSTIVSRLNAQFESTETYEIYTVQSGDTLSQLAQNIGISQTILQNANPQITDPNLIYAGEQIKIPHVISDGNASQAPQGTSIGPNQFYIDDTFSYDAQVIAWFTGVSESALLAANPGLDFNNLNPGQVVNLPSVINSLLTITTNTNPQPSQPGATDAFGQAGDVAQGYVLRETVDEVSLPLTIINGSGFWNTELSGIVSDDYRPGDANLLTEGYLGQQLSSELFQDFGYTNTWFGVAGELNNEAQQANQSIYVDPLVLDLNGDGVKLTDYTNNPVLFDIDHDGGTKEVAGWSSTQDGIMVMDLNGNGKIDDISETFSEYFNGIVGTSGNAGTKPYTDGFAALKSLDSNGDNVFSASDAAFANVRVWVDADHDGDTDAGELKTLSSLNISQINLNDTVESGLVRDGNEILASGTFVQSGQTKEALAANFLANPNGHSFVTSGSGTVVSTQGGLSSYVASNPAGETVNVAQKGVNNVYGGTGNDTLIGDATNNWLAGGAGSDTFNAGAGDDVLLIDASDLQANIHAGTGIDIVQVIGNQGVTLNLTQAEVEVAQGGRGNDVFISGGRSNTFVRGGEGDDILIGGAANDALSGEQGDDMIDGGAGNDLLRGHAGRDSILGGAGDDILEGGLDDDNLRGGGGNDVIKGGQGDDRIDGGTGDDMAVYGGSFADYRITRATDGVWISDSRTGGDGTDFLTGVERLGFRDLTGVDLNLASPMPVKDVVLVANRTTPITITSQQLLGNDLDYQGDALHITSVLDSIGGTASLTGNGDVLFTPDASFKGIMSFQYKLADSQNNPGGNVVNLNTGITAEIKATVYLKTPDMPNDPLLPSQWYINDTNVLPVWQDYSGRGVRIAQMEPPGSQFATEPQVFDYRHPDLQPNVDAEWLASGSIETAFSRHATLVAGVMVAANNGDGAVGIAHSASLAGIALSANLGDLLTNPQPLFKLKDFDVVNNSWNLAEDSWFWKITGTPDPYEQAVGLGRNQLGTILVYAGGNERATGGNTNYTTPMTHLRWGITVGGINAPGDLGSLVSGQKPFSNPGASILVSAPGSNINSTSRELVNDNGSVFGDDFNVASGTSLATPIVSGIAALMLEANPLLGYRDVQQILALSARQISDPNGTDWVYNGAANWNGGGMHVSHDYGFGDVDALAAVRLAETWTEQRTLANEQSLSVINTAGGAIPDGTGYIERTFSVQGGISVEHVELTVDLTHARWGDLIVELYSPNGTKSVLLNRPGKAPGSDGTDLGMSASGRFPQTLMTTHDWGESSGGTWKVRIYDAAAGATGNLTSLELRLYGTQETADDNYIYTNEYGTLFNGTTRNSLVDADGGYDTINAAALTSASTINLVNGANNTIAGKSFTLNGTIEAAIGGDGNDSITGNTGSNDLKGGRGDDILHGGAGADILDGGRGNDTYYGEGDQDMFVIGKSSNSVDTIMDYNPTLAVEKIVLLGFSNILDFTQLQLSQVGADTRLELGDGQSVIIKNVAQSQLSEQNFTFISNTGLNSPDSDWGVYKLLLSQHPILYGDNGQQNYVFDPGVNAVNYFAMGGDDGLGHSGDTSVLDGGNGNDYIDADYQAPVAGFDWVEGGSGNDELYGGGASDVVVGGSGNDYVSGGPGDDYLRGDTGLDVLVGEDDNDLLIGGPGDDYLDGGAGADTLLLEGDWGAVSGTNYGFYGTRIGGSGADIFKVVNGGQSGISVSGSQVSAFNFIADFDPTQPGELIDLSPLTWVRGFADLSITYQIVTGTSLATVSASSGAQGLTLNLWGVANGQLNAAHFKFANNLAITGGAGNDVLQGTAGGNLLDGGIGADRMTGRTGDDTYVVDNIGDQVFELPDGGFDTVRSSVQYTLPSEVENLTLTGTANINGTGNAHANRIVGNSGNNRLDGAAGADEMLGGAGDDIYIVDDGNDRIVELTGEGNDHVESSVSYTLSPDIEQLTLTGTGSVNATGNAANNALIGNTADNALDGGAGADSMTGGAGNDTYIVDNTGDSIIELLNEGIDTVFSSVNINLANNVENLVLTGTGALSGTGNTLDNVLTGNSANNTLNGGAGNDRLDGSAGSDSMTGGTGDDTYVVDNAGDVVNENANEGNDTVETSLAYSLVLRPNLENIVLTGIASIGATGNASANRLIGNSGNNTLTGNAGNDTLDGGAGTDTLIGGTSDDVYVVDNAGDVVTENANEGIDTIQSFVTRTLDANVENLTLIGMSAVNGTGNTLANVLIGNSADNTLNGDTGADNMGGGLGNDTYVVDNAGDMVTENANSGTDGIQSSVTYILGDNVENLILTGSNAINGTGNVLANSITGNSAANTLDGGGTGNAWEGAGGSDTLVGGAGNDVYITGKLAAFQEGLYGGYQTLTEDLVIENDTTVGNVDTLQLATPADAYRTLERHGNDLVIGHSRVSQIPWDEYGNYNEFYENVRIQNYFLGSQYQIEQVQYADGSTYSLASLINQGYWSLGTSGDDSVSGSGGNDILYAYAGNDTLDGGGGDDSLSGGLGNDTYLFGRGDGHDYVYGDGAGDIDTISLKGISLAQAGTVVFTRYLNDLIIGFTDAPDRLTVGNWWSAANTHLLAFTDATWDSATVDNHVTVPAGTAGNDQIWGSGSGDTIDGLAGGDRLWGYGGNDTLLGNTGDDQLVGGDGDDILDGGANSDWLYGQAGNDTLRGGDDGDVLYGDIGNDILEGGAGIDTLDGGPGNDILRGGAGNDYYFFNVSTPGVGIGQDTIQENDLSGSEQVIIQDYTWHTTPLDLVFQRSGNDLLMTHHNGTDQITVQDWYLGSEHRVESFNLFMGGTQLTQVDQLIQAMVQFSANNGGITWDQAIDQRPNDVQAVLAAYWQEPYYGSGGTA